MKHLVDYINEEWKWRNRSLSDEETEECHRILGKYIKQTYGKVTDETFLKCLEDNYKAYLEAGTTMSQDKIDVRYKKQIEYAKRIIKEHGYIQYLEYSLEQGFLDYIRYIAKQEKTI